MCTKWVPKLWMLSEKSKNFWWKKKWLKLEWGKSEWVKSEWVKSEWLKSEWPKSEIPQITVSSMVLFLHSAPGSDQAMSGDHSKWQDTQKSSGCKTFTRKQCAGDVCLMWAGCSLRGPVRNGGISQCRCKILLSVSELILRVPPDWQNQPTKYNVGGSGLGFMQNDWCWISSKWYKLN